MKVAMTRLVIAVMMLSFLLPNIAFAANDPYGFFSGNSYFQNIVLDEENRSNFDWIRNEYGSYSGYGYVMPNWVSDDYSVSSGGGAVGKIALGVSNTETDSAKLKKALYDYLYKANTNQLHAGNTKAGEWDKMGSAVVVYTLLGKTWGSGPRTVSTQDWTDLKTRMVDNSDVEMIKALRSVKENTAGIKVDPPNDTGKLDAARYTYYGDFQMDSWVFKQKNGSKTYAIIEIICANPIGNFEGVPSTPVKTDTYDLKPTATIKGSQTVVEPGGSVTVENKVNNEGKDKSGSTIWRLTEMVFSPGATLNASDKAGRDNELDPCAASGEKAFPSAGRTSCKTSPGQDRTNEIFDPSNPKTSDYTFNVPSNTPVGTKFCFTTSVKPPAQDKLNQWRHSALQCIIVAKKPKVQVWGGDVRAGGTISASTNTLDGKTYGSWGEYGALSNGQNTGFASGNGLNSGNANSAQSGWSGLTFANTGGTCTFGCYNFTLTSRSLTDQFGTGNALPGGGDINSWPNGTYTTNGLTLSGITINKGKSIVIISTGTVTINGDIAYNDGPYTSLKDIPQLVIRAPVINIQGNVGRVDAWLFAITATNSGVLNTCSDVGVDAQLTANICNNQLAINGPVVADKIYLRRTAGSDGSEPTRGKPAETFNLRADAYLWGSGYTNGKGKVRTVYTKELAPRF